MLLACVLLEAFRSQASLHGFGRTLGHTVLRAATELVAALQGPLRPGKSRFLDISASPEVASMSNLMLKTPVVWDLSNGDRRALGNRFGPNSGRLLVAKIRGSVGRTSFSAWRDVAGGREVLWAAQPPPASVPT